MEINQADHNMAIKDEPEQSGIVYYDAKDSALFGLYGIDDKKENGYPRFNAKERELISKVSKDVEFLSYHSAGIQLKFETDSSQIYFKATNQKPSDMDNLSNIAQSGIALYSFDEKENCYFLQGVTRFSPKASSYNVPMLNFPQSPRKNRKYVAYLPSYMGVVSLEVGLEKGAKVKPVGFSPKNWNLWHQHHARMCNFTARRKLYEYDFSILGSRSLEFRFLWQCHDGTRNRHHS